MARRRVEFIEGGYYHIYNLLTGLTRFGTGLEGEMIGKVIKDRYRIYDEIGQGSVAAIYPLTREALERGKAIPTGMASVLREISADVRSISPAPLPSGWA